MSVPVPVPGRANVIACARYWRARVTLPEGRGSIAATLLLAPPLGAAIWRPAKIAAPKSGAAMEHGGGSGQRSASLSHGQVARAGDYVGASADRARDAHGPDLCAKA